MASTSEPDQPATPGAVPDQSEPTLAEDLLLVLFQPDAGLRSGAGAIAGEGTLFYVLAGAVLAELGLAGQVRTSTGRLGAILVEAVPDGPPADDLLRLTWDYVADKPREVQGVLAAQGPTLRGPLLDRLVERGDIHRSTRKTLGVFNSAVLAEGDSGRRAGLIADLRAVLVAGADRGPRTAALAGLVYASGTLPQFGPEIPWTGPMIARAEALKNGDWGAGAAAEAVARTIAATIVNSVVIATAVQSRG